MCQVSQALKAAEEQHQKQWEESGVQQLEALREEVVCLQSQLEQARREQAALLKVELAGAKAAWNRDKQQEISSIQVRNEQVYQAKLQDEQKKLEGALRWAREDAKGQKKERLLQMEAKLQQMVQAKEEEWRRQQAETQQAQRQQIKEVLRAEILTGLAEVQTQLLRDPQSAQHAAEEGTITHMIQTSCTEMVKGAVSQAKKAWEKVRFISHLAVWKGGKEGKKPDSAGSM